jgi:hypothetical protein
MLKDSNQRQALPARAGFGGQSYQTPNPPFGAASLKVRPTARTCPVHAVLACLSFYGVQSLLIYFTVDAF